MKYPRKPNGPSAIGSAGVRALENGGGDWQRTSRTNGTQSFVQGQFKKVLVDEAPEYLAEGFFEDPDEYTIQETGRIESKFRKSRADLIGVPLGNGLYAHGVWLLWGSASRTFEYPAYSGATPTEFDLTHRATRNTMTFGSYLSGGSNAVVFFSHQYQYPVAGLTQWIQTAPPFVYAGQSEDNGRVVTTAALVDEDYLDSAGRSLLTPAVLRAYSKKPDLSTYERIPVGSFTRIDAEFSHFIQPVVTGRYALYLMAEHFFAPGNVDPMRDYRPKFWAVKTDVDDMRNFTAHDMTGDLFNNGAVPSVIDPLGVPHYSPNSGNSYNNRVNLTMALMNAVVMENDEVLIMFRQYMQGGQWRMRIGKIQAQSMSMNLVHVVEGDPLAYAQSAVYLGNGVVLVKRCQNFDGVNIPVDFMRSTDYGQTWGIFTPTGFDAPMFNQYLGNLRVRKAATADDAGEVLIVSWNPLSSSYCVYSSKDLGSTWVRKGVVKQSPTFSRIDTMVAGDGGGNFRDLVPGPKLTTKVDPALPNRYKR